MSSFRNPVGPQPSSVYWRRRLIVGLGLLAIIIVIVLIIVAPKGGSDPAPTATKTSHTPTPSESATPDVESATPCEPANIKLTPVTDKDSYAAGEQPMISMTIANIGTEACMINAGTDVQVYTITSGADPIWNSTDCQSNPVTTPIVLEPGEDKAQSTTPFPWDRTRSSKTTCDETRTQVAAGGGTYRLAVALGDIQSEGDKPFLLY